MMKKFLIFMTILCSGYFMSQTQLKLNEVAEKKYEKTWNELNVLQNKLLLKYKTQKEMTNKINRPNIGDILFVNKQTWDDMKDIQHCFKMLEEFEHEGINWVKIEYIGE